MQHPSISITHYIQVTHIIHMSSLDFLLQCTTNHDILWEFERRAECWKTLLPEGVKFLSKLLHYLGTIIATHRECSGLTMLLCHSYTRKMNLRKGDHKHWFSNIFCRCRYFLEKNQTSCKSPQRFLVLFVSSNQT